MDNETYLKELAKHVQRNNPNTKREDSNQKKIQIKTFKAEGEYEKSNVFNRHQFFGTLPSNDER